MSDPIAPLNAALKGRYAIEREFGEGAVATVYPADDLKHERTAQMQNSPATGEGPDRLSNVRKPLVGWKDLHPERVE